MLRSGEQAPSGVVEVRRRSDGIRTKPGEKTHQTRRAGPVHRFEDVTRLQDKEVVRDLCERLQRRGSEVGRRDCPKTSGKSFRLFGSESPHSSKPRLPDEIAAVEGLGEETGMCGVEDESAVERPTSVGTRADGISRGAAFQ
jgi:hypothetical protein